MATYVTLAPEGEPVVEMSSLPESGKFASIKFDTVSVYIPGYDAESIAWMRRLAAQLLDAANVMEGNPVSDHAWLNDPNTPAEPPSQGQTEIDVELPL